MPGYPLFDSYIIVDWSAASRPKTGQDSIWIGRLTRENSGAKAFESWNPPTRTIAHEALTGLLDDLTARGQRVLVGFDFSLGFPAGTAKAAGLVQGNETPWQAMWRWLEAHIEDQTDNTNNRFALAAELNQAISGRPFPFWGVPPRQATKTLQPKKSPFGPGHDDTGHDLAEFRLTEDWISKHFKARPKSVWQLLGAGAVGSQSLLGIPVVAHLRRHLPASRVWPFETGLAPLTKESLKEVSCVFAEVYPSTIEVSPHAGETRDAAQVRTLCTHLAEADDAGLPGPAFTAEDSTQRRKIVEIVDEEGWILAFRAQMPRIY